MYIFKRVRQHSVYCYLGVNDIKVEMLHMQVFRGVNDIKVVMLHLHVFRGVNDIKIEMLDPQVIL